MQLAPSLATPTAWSAPNGVSLCSSTCSRQGYSRNGHSMSTSLIRPFTTSTVQHSSFRTTCAPRCRCGSHRDQSSTPADQLQAHRSRRTRSHHQWTVISAPESSPQLRSFLPAHPIAAAQGIWSAGQRATTRTGCCP
ncbi:hypothetical protein BCR44DRAFT_1449600 [Catenaria anguillulae PL171]|uniref:Uncharacterized protein n=1 Tax=Catenaria anguillulae PL171 TaxID=765915 RepID=A0A1Y2H4R6_9FUNG|nr:hypothetical protein BCR44DRAFT_1449600 [Catenaria anguillulae PL171]